MAMLPTDMASSLMGSVSGLTEPGGVNLLWNAVCNYVEANAIVTCAWVAATTTVPPTPDPMVSVIGSINTSAGRILSLPGIDRAPDAASALGILSTAMNLAVQRWVALLPVTQGFATSPGVVTVPSTIALIPSMTTDRYTAFLSMASNIILGLKSVVFSPVAGSHLVYVGAGTFIPGIF